MAVTLQPDTADILRDRFVRVRNRRANGLVEFDFAIGAPEIFVELLMPIEAFEAFCATNNVIDITGQDLAHSDFEVRFNRVLAGQDPDTIMPTAIRGEF